MNGFNSWIDTLEILSSEAVSYSYIFSSRELSKYKAAILAYLYTKSIFLYTNIHRCLDT